MFKGGLNLIRKAIAEKYPIPQGLGNSGFSEFTCPVTLIGGGLRCDLKSDPLIAVSRSNDIACRNVAKPRMHGSIKESWAIGDWEVTIGGVIVADSVDELSEAVRELSEICAVRESLEVTCEMLNDQYDITRIAVKDLQLPFTQGELNQQFSITALSDSSYELLEEV